MVMVLLLIKMSNYLGGIILNVPTSISFGSKNVLSQSTINFSSLEEKSCFKKLTSVNPLIVKLSREFRCKTNNNGTEYHFSHFSWIYCVFYLKLGILKQLYFSTNFLCTKSLRRRKGTVPIRPMYHRHEYHSTANDLPHATNQYLKYRRNIIL